MYTYTNHESVCGSEVTAPFILKLECAWNCVKVYKGVIYVLHWTVEKSMKGKVLNMTEYY
jgi:hypothetical protein